MAGLAHLQDGAGRGAASRARPGAASEQGSLPGKEGPRGALAGKCACPRAERPDDTGESCPAQEEQGDLNRSSALSRASVCDLVEHHLTKDGAALLTLLQMRAGTSCVLANAHDPQHRLTARPAPLPGREKFPQTHSLQTHVLFRSHCAGLSRIPAVLPSNRNFPQRVKE